MAFQLRSVGVVRWALRRDWSLRRRWCATKAAQLCATQAEHLEGVGAGGGWPKKGNGGLVLTWRRGAVGDGGRGCRLARGVRSVVRSAAVEAVDVAGVDELADEAVVDEVV